MTKDQQPPTDPQPPQKEVDKAADDKSDETKTREAPAPAYRITDWAAI